MGLILNGSRNYEYLSTYIGAIILEEIPSFAGMVFIERMNDFDRSEYPIINIMLESVTPDQRDAVNSRYICSISITVITDNLTDGNENTSKTKAKVLSIVGKIDNLLCKQLNYQLKYTGKVIANFDHPQIDFSSTKVFNASGVIGAQMTMNYTIEENNNNLYEDIITETNLKITNEGKLYFWNDKEN